MPEIRPIPFAPGYFVSDDGRVYSEKYKKTSELRPWHIKGYPAVGLRVGGAKINLLVHRIVLTTFVGQQPFGQECRHLDGDRKNANVANLAWGTPEENAADIIRHGRQTMKLHPERAARGDRHGWRTHPESLRKGDAAAKKLTSEKVRGIRSRMSDLARQHNVTIQLIYNIKHNKCWKSVA